MRHFPLFVASCLVAFMLPIVLAQITNLTTSTTYVPLTTTSSKLPASTVFYVRDFMGYVCLVMKLEATFHVPYLTTANRNETAEVDLGKVVDTEVTGTCRDLTLETKETMQLQWYPKPSLTPPWKLSLVLLQHVNLTYYISSLQVDFLRDSALFPQAVDVDSRHHLHAILPENPHNESLALYETALGSYYQCLAEEKVFLQEGAWMQVHAIVLNAFRGARNDTAFSGTRRQCSTDAFASNIVPIIVGSVLAFLILLVLLTYLIGRRRSHAGYQNI